MLSKEAIEEFKKIWREEKNEEISDDFALEEAINLLTLFDKIHRSIKQEWLKKYEYDSTSK